MDRGVGSYLLARDWQDTRRHFFPALYLAPSRGTFQGTVNRGTQTIANLLAAYRFDATAETPAPLVSLAGRD